MEVLLLTGLGLLGWSLSAPGTHRRTQRTEHVHVGQHHEYPFDPDMTTTLLDRDTKHLAKSIRDSRDAIDAYRHGPFQSSDKTQSVTTKRKLDLFTGNDSHAWAPKEEFSPLFDPEEKKTRVSSGGLQRPAEVDYDERDYTDRNVFTGKMNNALPFVQQRVGPGVGYDASVTSADGHHSSFRVLPTHAMNAHRINQLPGRSTAGEALIKHGSTRYDTVHQKAPSLVEYQPNVGPGRTVFSGHAAQSFVDPKPTRSDGVTMESYAGGPTYCNTGRQIRTQPLHVQKEHAQLDTLPMYGDRMDIQAPTQTVSIHDRVDVGTKRGQGCAGLTGTSAVTTHATYHDQYNIRQKKAGTLTYDPNDLMTGAASSQARGPLQDGRFVLKETARDTETPYMPGSGAFNSAGTSRHEYMESSGHRELQAQNTGPTSFIKGKTLHSDVLLSRGRETVNQPAHGSVQGGVFESTVQPPMSHRKLKSNAYVHDPYGAHMPHAIQRESPGQTSSNKKIPSLNPRAHPSQLGLGLVDKET